MKRENRKNILFRYGSIVALILLLSMRIVYKLADNTVMSADKWNAKAAATLSSIDTILPVRGNILAADGSVLATNMRVYTPTIDFRVPKFDEKYYKQAIDSLADSLAKYFPERDSKAWGEYLARPLKKKKENRTRSFPIVKKLSYDQWRLVRTFPFLKARPKITGLYKQEELARVRPYGDMARRSIGAVGQTKTVKVPFGIYGLEKALDSLLTGQVGYSKKVPLTSAIVDWTDMPPVDGYDVLTTIDIKMQDIVETELNKVLDVCKADWGTAVLMEVGTGDIKAIVNLERNAESGETYIESLNYAVRRVEPGSVVKALSLLIAMEDGRVPNLNKVYSTGSNMRIGNTSLQDCSKSDTLSLNRALEISSNIVTSKMILDAYRDDPGRFYTRIKQSGFLDRFHTGIAEEVAPRIDSLGAKDLVSLTRQSFGYATEISPLYTCALYNAIAGGGRFVRPRLVRGVRGNGIDSVCPVSYVRDRICSEATAKELRTMLHKVVWGPRGTARRIVKSDKVEIAGKTGTANMIRDGKYVRGISRLSFCGFFPYNNPRYTCMVVVAYPRETWRSPETTSGRVVKNVAEAMFARGMLGNSTDYKTDTQRQGDYPVYYACLDNNVAAVHGLIGGGSKAMLAKPSKVKSGVPNVIGLGLREALEILEKAGYNVKFTGSGYVSAQTPTPGTASKPGTKVTLTLHE